MSLWRLFGKVVMQPNNIELSITRIVDSEQQVSVLFDLYKENLTNVHLAVQKKPILEKKEFSEICKDQFVYKVIISYEARIIGLFLIAQRIDNYPDSHYASEYFRAGNKFRNTSTAWDKKNVLFVIGDSGGLIISRDFNSILGKLEKSLKNIYEEVFSKLKKVENIDSILILNFSEHARRIIKMRDSQFDPLELLQSEFKTETLDFETFVHIHWMDNFFGKSRILGAIKYAGTFNKNLNGDQNGMKQVFTLNKLFSKRYSIWHYSIIEGELADTFYTLYQKRLEGVNERSPQKLQYTEVEFKEYLRDGDYDKYLLLDKNGTVVGGFILIGKNNAQKASWVTPQWRVADAYIKIIFVNRNEARYAYLILFVVSSFDLLKRQGAMSNTRILADWSDLLNGKKFRHSLNINPIPFLPELISKQKLKPDNLVARLLVKMANFRATLLDNDVYIAVERKEHA